jgi:hypothetical protein
MWICLLVMSFVDLAQRRFDHGGFRDQMTRPRFAP